MCFTNFYYFLVRNILSFVVTGDLCLVVAAIISESITTLMHQGVRIIYGFFASLYYRYVKAASWLMLSFDYFGLMLLTYHLWCLLLDLCMLTYIYIKRHLSGYFWKSNLFDLMNWKIPYSVRQRVIWHQCFKTVVGLLFNHFS